MSGRRTCESLVKEQDNRNRNKRLSRLVDGIATLGISEFMRKEEGSNNRNVNIINNNISEIKKKISENRCENISTISQQNIFIQPTTCLDSIFKNCTNLKNNTVDTECLDILMPILRNNNNNKPVEQKNINETTSICEINSSLEVLSQKDRDEDNLKTIQLLQDAKAKASNKSTDGLNCTQIDNNITKEKYISSFLECSSKISVNQKNIIEGCSPNISSQLNDNNEMKRCLQDMGIIGDKIINNKNEKSNEYEPVESDTPQTSTNTTSNTTSNNNGIPIEIIIIGGCICFIIIIIIILLLIKKNPSNK
jgi:hypothetical protein